MSRQLGERLYGPLLRSLDVPRAPLRTHFCEFANWRSSCDQFWNHATAPLYRRRNDLVHAQTARHKGIVIEPLEIAVKLPTSNKDARCDQRNYPRDQ